VVKFGIRDVERRASYG